MATKSATLQLKSSTTAGVTPAGLLAAEPAINIPDKKLFAGTGSATFQVAPTMAEHALKEDAIAAGTTAQFWRGDKTWQALGAAVLSVVLTGLSTATSTAVVASDSLLVAIGKLQAQITLRAPLASPALTGTPTAPTATAGTNTTQVATTAFVAAQAAAADFDVLNGGTF